MRRASWCRRSGPFQSLPADGQLANVIQSIGGRADVVDRFTGTPNSTGGVYALIAGTSPGGANSSESGLAGDQ